MQPFSVSLDLEKALMLSPKRLVRRSASDMRGYYKDAEALERLIAERGDSLHYEVSEVPVPEEAGQLMYCVSTLQPGLVGDECFMTKGHYHAAAATAEIYLGLAGGGFLVMKTADGAFACEPIERGRMVYVPPCWAHRSVNTGTEPLVSFCVYPADAGHNYGDIATEGFPMRVFIRNGKEVIE